MEEHLLPGIPLSPAHSHGGWTQPSTQPCGQAGGCCLHFKGEEIEAARVEVTCPGSVEESGFASKR